MNERIKELAKSLDYDTDFTPSDNETDREYQVVSNNFAEKFAELIVRECMNTIKQNENASLNVSNFTDEKKQGIHLGLEFAIADIAEHFGVDECH